MVRVLARTSGHSEPDFKIARLTCRDAVHVVMKELRRDMGFDAICDVFRSDAKALNIAHRNKLWLGTAATATCTRTGSPMDPEA